MGFLQGTIYNIAELFGLQSVCVNKKPHILFWLVRFTFS